MKSAAERIDALMQIHPKGFDLSLDRIRGLLEKLSNPQDRIPPVIHVAGTNGKGSTIAFCRGILEAAGLAVHVHTSPHLVNWNERYRIGRKNAPGQLADDAVLSEAIRRVADANDGKPITVFEILSAVMFVLFSEHPADVCLIEVGLGGRFDATNVVADPAVTIITPVSLDHEAYLGDTLAKIAFEKAGIIKHKVPLICGPQGDEASDVIIRQAARHKAPMQIAGQDFTGHREEGRMVWQSDNRMIDLPVPRLPGAHQIENSANAVAACLAFCASRNLTLDDETIAEGVTSANWPGRMQSLTHGKLFDILPKDTEVWLDGGHNPGAAKMIFDFLQQLEANQAKPLTMICGMLTTKDPSGYFDALLPLRPKVITVPIVSSDAGFSARDLEEHARASDLDAQSANSLTEALGLFANTNNHNNRIESPYSSRLLISGSLYLVGDVLDQNGTPPM